MLFSTPRRHPSPPIVVPLVAATSGTEHHCCSSPQPLLAATANHGSFSEEDAQGIDEPHNPAPMVAARGDASSARGGATSMRAGIMFLKSIDASDYVKTGEKLFELLDDVVEEICEQNIVQVVTDNGSNYVLAVTLAR
ncbi:hypothetical protein AHAS_Ahas19G0213400 [Arachis hypogaea]